MNELILALGPAFAAGFAIQRLLEILEPLLDRYPPLKDNKKIILGISSLAVGLLLAFGAGLSVLKPLGVTDMNMLVDGLVTALIVSAGTEGLNSIMKFLGYAKENKKAVAAESKDKVSETAVSSLTKTV